MEKRKRKWMLFLIILLSIILLIALFLFGEYKLNRGKYQCDFQKMHGDIQVLDEYPLDILCVVTGDYAQFWRKSMRVLNSNAGKNQVHLIGCSDYSITKTQFQFASHNRSPLLGKRKAAFILTLTVKSHRNNNNANTLKQIQILEKTFSIGSVRLLHSPETSAPLHVKSANVLYDGFGVKENEFTIKNTGKSVLSVQNVNYGSLDDDVQSRHYHSPVRISPGKAVSMKTSFNIQGMDAYFITPIVKYTTGNGKTHALYVDTCHYGAAFDRDSLSRFMKNYS